MKLAGLRGKCVDDLAPVVRINVVEAKHVKQHRLAVEGSTLLNHDAAQDVSNLTPEALLDAAAKLFGPFGVEIDPQAAVALKGGLEAVDGYDISQAARHIVKGATRD